MKNEQVKKSIAEEMKKQEKIAHPIWDAIYVESQEEEKGEMKMAEQIETIETIEEIEEVKTTGKYIPDDELAESKRLMRGKTLYTINKNMEIVETVTVRCNPSSYDYDALKLFLENNRELLSEYHNSDNNYGIGFYACGYDGRAQQEFAQDWADSGVMVF